MKPSEEIAHYASGLTYENISAKAVVNCKKSLLDGLGVMLAAGTLCEECRSFVDMALASGGKGESTVFGHRAKLPAFMAAFANGSLAHALDFEDTHDGARVHPNAASIPAALAVAESIGKVSGKALITALVVGCDVTSRMGLALKEDPIVSGWYIPPILNAFGATAAAGKLLGLNRTQFLDAFSLALCQATCSAELIHNPHTVIRAVRDAFSAKAGVMSALLAEKGVPGFEQPLEGSAGFFRLYARHAFDLSRLTKALGETFEGENVSFKPWPCCRGTHGFLEAALKLIEDHGIDPVDIDTVKIVTSSSALQKALCEPLDRKKSPRTAIDAKFSIPFVVAIALTHGEVTLKHFTNEALSDEKVLTTAGRIRLAVDEALWDDQGALELVSKDRVYMMETPEFVYGHPGNPMAMDDVIKKFEDCASYAGNKISKEARKKLIDAILNLEDHDDIRVISQAL
jgi:2-methylcitrate dehydratase PrpD